MKPDFSDATIAQCRAFLDEAMPGNQIVAKKWSDESYDTPAWYGFYDSEIEALQVACRVISGCLGKSRRAHCQRVARRVEG